MALTWNDLYARRKLRNYIGHILREAFNVAATIQVDKRKSAGEEMIAHVNDV